MPGCVRCGVDADIFFVQSIVGVPPEIREENDNFRQAIPVQ